MNKPYPRFICHTCHREVASKYRWGVTHTNVGGSEHYAYIRRHRGSDGKACPATTTTIATVLRPA